MRHEEHINDDQEAARLMMEDNQAQVWTAMPGIVKAVDLAKQTVSVQPSIQGTVTSSDGSEKHVNLPMLVDVPIVWPKAGGFALTFPIAVEDEVLVVFASRCIDTWWQNGGVGVQAEKRMHDLSDGFAILAPTSQPRKLASVSSQNVQLRNTSGDTYMEITPDGKIKLAAKTQIDVVGPIVNVTGSDKVVVAAPNIALNGAVAINGGLTQSGGGGAVMQTSINIQGGINVAGGATITGGATVNGIAVQSHVHTNVQPGSGLTGAPK